MAEQRTDRWQLLLPFLALISCWMVPTAHSYDLGCDSEVKYALPPRGQPADPVKLQDAAFVGAKDGSPVQLKAISWYGVHDNLTEPALSTLWSAGDAAAVGDLPAVAYALRAAGFNAVRLPFSFADLRAPARSAWVRQGCVKVELGAGGQQQQQQHEEEAAARAQDRCRWYLPDGGDGGDGATASSLGRYLWALRWFASNGFYVLAEFRPAPGEATSRNEQGFADAWRWLWRAVACAPGFEADLQGRVFAGLLAAPDRLGHRWEDGGGEGSGGAEGGPPGLAALYLAAMDALWAETPGGVAFFVEGAGQGGAATWGHGFVTDREIVAVNDYSDPNPFFEALLAKPYRGAVALSPAVYDSAAPAPPDDPTDPNRRGPPLPTWPAGAGPLKVLDTTFGYLAREGYCAGDGAARDCQRFPVAIGEFASKLPPLAAAAGLGGGTGGAGAGSRELAALNAFAAHLSGAGVDYGGVGTWRFWGFGAGGAEAEGGSGGGSGGAAEAAAASAQQ